MIIYPAIDIRKGKCVRLYQGNYDLETIYSVKPQEVVNDYVASGASWLHIVDLDAAEEPNENQTSFILDMIQKDNIKVQIGGGIRSKMQIKNLLAQGADRIIVGSKAVNDYQEVYDWFKHFGADKIVLALDVMIKDNFPVVAINGWKEITNKSLYDLLDYYSTIGLTHLLCTNISLDGTLNGPDFELYDQLLKKFPVLKLQASGGVRSIADVIALRQKQLSGVIVGRALYEKKFTLSEVLSC